MLAFAARAAARTPHVRAGSKGKSAGKTFWRLYTEGVLYASADMLEMPEHFFFRYAECPGQLTCRPAFCTKKFDDTFP